jgi:WD40 repeat protein
LAEERLDINEHTISKEEGKTVFPVPQQEKSNIISTETPAKHELVILPTTKKKTQYNQGHEQLGGIFHEPNAQMLNIHAGEVHSLAWSPDGRYLASAGADKTIFIFEYVTRLMFLLRGEHNKIISTLSWSPDGTHLCAGDKDGFIHIWDIVSRRKLLTYDKHRVSKLSAIGMGQNEVWSVAWSPDGRYIASGGTDCIAHVWNALSGDICYQYKGHALGRDETEFHAAVAISSIVWSRDGWRLATASCKFDDTLDRDISFQALKVIPGIGQFVEWNQYAKIHIWNAFTGDHVLVYPGHKIGVTALAQSPNGSAIASAGKDKTVQIWNPVALHTSTGFSHSRIYRGHTDQVKAVAWSPDGTYLASTGSDTTVQVWNASTGNRIYTYQRHKKCVRALAWSPINNVIASAGDDQTIHLWSAPKLETE